MSARRLVAGLLSALALVVAIITVLGGGDDGGDPGAGGGSGGGESGRVLRVVDGDTLRVRLDGQDERIRLALIDAPESSALRYGHAEPCGADATRRLRQLVANRRVRLTRPSSQDRDRYGRLLREVHAGGRSIDEQLVAEGWARPYRVPARGGGAAANRRIAAAADDARRHRRGVWARCGGFDERR